MDSNLLCHGVGWKPLPIRRLHESSSCNRGNGWKSFGPPPNGVCGPNPLDFMGLWGKASATKLQVWRVTLQQPPLVHDVHGVKRGHIQNMKKRPRGFPADSPLNQSSYVFFQAPLDCCMRPAQLRNRKR